MGGVIPSAVEESKDSLGKHAGTRAPFTLSLSKREPRHSTPIESSPHTSSTETDSFPQSAELGTSNPKVLGSHPGVPTKCIDKIFTMLTHV